MQIPAPTTLTGTLSYREPPQVKSVEAYLHNDFTLTTDAGERYPLVPGPSVSHAAIKALDGKSVVVEVHRREASAPNPRESSPMGPDGKPLMRPPRFEVLSIRAR